MKKYIIKYGAWVASLASAVGPAAAFAQQGQLPGVVIGTPGQAIIVICSIAGWLFTFLIVFAIIFVILAAYNYLTAGGDSAKVSAASSQLIYAAVAVAVAIFARSLPLLVSGLIPGAGQIIGC